MVNKNIKYFSLIELMIVIFIISIITYIAVDNYMKSLEDSKIMLASNELKTLKEGFLKYYTKEGGFPKRYPLKKLIISGIIDNQNNAGSETYQMIDPWGNPYIFKYTSAGAELPFSSTGALINSESYYNVKCEVGCNSSEYAGYNGIVDTTPEVWISVGEGRIEPK